MEILIATDDWVIYVDATGRHAPEIEMFEIAGELEDDDDDALGEIYRFSLDRCRIVTEINGEECIPYLTTGPTDGPHAHDHKEWFSDNLKKIASSAGRTVADLQAAFTSDDVIERAHAYQDVCGYHGVINFDQYPNRESRASWDARKRCALAERGEVRS